MVTMSSRKLEAIQTQTSPRTAIAAGKVRQRDAMPLGEGTVTLRYPLACVNAGWRGFSLRDQGPRIIHDHPHNHLNSRTTGPRRPRACQQNRRRQSAHDWFEFRDVDPEPVA